MATANFLYQDDFRLMAGEFSFPVYAVDEDGEEILVSVDDDDEFDRVSDIFEDEVFSDIDYDENSDK